MPIYEYICPQCNGRFQKLVQGFRDPEGLACPRCANPEVRRAISRFATLRSDDARVESLADPSTFADLDETDPASVARWAKRLGRELGEDAGEDWDELVDELIEDELGDEAGGRGKPKEDDLGWA
jgi:putative FmdB family regulatory protein